MRSPIRVTTGSGVLLHSPRMSFPAIAPILWTGAATAAWWGSLLSLPESQISSIRYWSVFASATALILVAWSLYIRTLRKLRLVEQQLVDARNQTHRFQDDCFPDERLHLYRHPTKTGFFCVACAASKDSLASLMRKQDNGWVCPLETSHFVPDPDYKAPPPQPPIRQPWQRF